jgi:exopolyphosphatase/guanosine-5'-triphosphate,3'-diphosphate pyrophosphatase
VAAADASVPTSPSERSGAVAAIDTVRILERRQEHVGVIDIGSNSIRLVVYDDLGRAPFPRFNEKSFTALGTGLDEHGRFTDRAIADAVRAIRRFAEIAGAMDVRRLDALATEATRRARNGSDLLEAIETATGLRPHLLTGEDEAAYAALGVVSGFHRPKGLVGDIGGGSLEVAEVVVDRVGERTASMPIGALPVRALMVDDPGRAKSHVDEILAAGLPPLLTDPTFYAVGGGWRALARVHIATTEQPINVVHGYAIPADEARSFARKISRMDPGDVAALPDVPTRRIETLPAAALVLSQLLKQLRPEQVVFSAYGLREGWLHAQLDPDEQARDPLLEGAQTIGLPLARVPSFSAALAEWTDGLFPGESPGDRRLRLAACALTDMCWRDHAKVQADEAFRRLLNFPFTGITHGERAFLAVAIMARYGGRVAGAAEPTVGRLLSASELRRAEILGRALLLGHRFSASVPEILAQSRLRIDTDAVRLEVSSPDVVPDSDAVHTRLRQLAKATGVDGAEIVRTGESTGPG